MKALVTGGSGYFGSVVVKGLKEAGYQVRILDRLDSDDRPSEVEFIQGDIRDPKAVRRACEGVSVVHHNVAQVPLAKDKELFESVNVKGAEVLFEACLLEGVTKVVNVSSSAVFGAPSSNPVLPSTSPCPREAYGRAKLRAEQVAARYVQRGLDITTVRPRTILGHGRLGIFQLLFELVRRGRPIYVLGKGDNLYQFVHAGDLARACILAGEASGPSIFNVGAEEFGTMRQTLEALASHAATGSPVRSLPMLPAVTLMNLTSRLRLSPLGPYHALMYGREMFFDVEHVKERLGWKPRFSNRQMLCESYDNYVANLSEVLSRKDASHHRSALKAGVLRLLMYMP